MRIADEQPVGTLAERVGDHGGEVKRLAAYVRTGDRTGIVPSTLVPPPGVEATSRVPPSASRRSFMPWSPLPDRKSVV